MDKNKKDSILIKNTNTRNENLLNNKGKYRAYDKDLGLIVGASYNVYGNEKNSSNKSQHLDILRYTHNGKTDFSKDIHENYGVNGETLKYYVGNNVKPSYTVNDYDGFSDYISYIWDTYGQEESYAGHLLGLLGVRDLAEDLAYDMVPDFKGKTATDVINEILQYTDIKYAMEGDRVGIVKDIDVAMAVLGAVTTNKNNYSGKDTRMGMISNRMYGGTLLNAARFNSLRRSKYITPELEKLYGNNLHNVYNLSSLFRLNEETGRIAEPDSNNYIHELPEGNVFDYLPTVIHDFKLPEGEYDWSIHPNYGPNELKYEINYKGETKFDTKGGSYGLTDRRGIFVYSEGDNKNELEIKDYSNYRFNEVESVASMNVVDVVDEIDMTEKTLLQKTNDFLRKRKINTIISRFHDKDNRKGGMTQSSYSPTFGISHGRNLLTKNAWENGSADIINGYTNPYCRVWTNHHQYSKMKHLIRPFISDETFTSIEELQKDWISFRTENASQRLSDFGVLNKNGMVNITPSLKDGIDIKKCMFSIENLAWKDVITSQEGKYRLNKNNGSSNSQYDWEVDNENVLSEEQRGPNGGRIMWFPPYDLTFQETASAKWSENEFIGRGEPVYTYNNSTRSGTLEFTILVDHPAIVDYWMENKRDNATEDDEQSLLRFFAGCDPLGESKDTLLGLKEDANKEKVKDPKEIIEEKDIVFYTFFPNNFSGVDDKGMGIDRIFGGMGRNDLKVKTDSGDFYLGYEMGINPMSIDSFSITEQNKPAIWMLENIYTIVDAEKKFEDIESVKDVVDSLSLSVDDESGIAYYLCDCTIEKYEELCEKINSSDDEEIEEGTIQFIEEIEDIFQISAPLSKTNALFIYYNYSGYDVDVNNATSDELIESCTWEGETAISAYARYKCSQLKTYNTKGNEKPYEILNEKQEVACKTIDESSVERYWYIKFRKSKEFPYEIVKNKREFSRLNLNFGVKEDKSEYFVKFNDDVYSFDNHTDSFNFIVNNNLLTKVESKDDFTKKDVKYGFNKNDKEPYYYYSIEDSNEKDIMEHIKSALEDEGDETYIIKKYYEGHKFGCLKDFGVGENYGMIQFFITGKLQKNGYGYDSVQDFIARHDIQKHNEKTPVTSNEFVSKGIATTISPDIKDKQGNIEGKIKWDVNNPQWSYPIDVSKENEKLENINYFDTKSFGLNSTYEMIKKEMGDESVSFSFGEVYAAIHGEEEKSFVLSCERAILSDVLKLGKTEVEEKIKEASDRIEYLKKVFNPVDGISSLQIEKIETLGSASSHGKTNLNNQLSNNRETAIQEFIKSLPIAQNTDISSITFDPDGNTTNKIVEVSKINPKDVNDISAKKGRYARVNIVVKQKENSETTKDTKSGKSNSDISREEIIRKKHRRYDNESRFFEMLKENDSVAYNRLVDKVKYFSPAFHSITPEGFNARLTFLHQCTRQGPTATSSDISTGSTAANLAFGRAPFCILRLGDFLNTKIVITSVNITYPDSMWDLNPEGIGVQFMMAKVSMQINILGGSDISAPIKRLQNAVSFNYYANTSLYDNRSDMAEYSKDGKTIFTKKEWFPTIEGRNE